MAELLNQSGTFRATIHDLLTRIDLRIPEHVVPMVEHVELMVPTYHLFLPDPEVPPTHHGAVAPPAPERWNGLDV